MNFADIDTGVHRTREEPWHRQAARLLVQGVRKGEVAKLFGDRGGQNISALLRSSFFRKLIEEESKNLGTDLTKCFSAEALASVDTIVQIRDNEKASTATRLAAAVHLLDRVLGKATQKVELSKTEMQGSPEEQIENLRRQRAELLKQTAN